MHLLDPTGFARLFLDQTRFKKQKHPFTTISRMFFLNMDFYFTYIANFNFPHFEIEESFGLIWVKLENCRFHLQFSFWVFKGC